MTLKDELAAWMYDLPVEKLEGPAERESLKWSGRKRVYLEGPSDYEIIAVRWFHSTAKVDFKSHGQDEGGCVWVLKQVTEQTGTYGIVDRDTLLNCDQFELYFETDDNVFKNQWPFGLNVLVLSRHELENFLLDLPSLLHLIRNRGKQLDGSRKISTIEDLCKALLTIARTVMGVDAICAVFRLHGLPSCEKLRMQCFVREPLENVNSDVENIFETLIDGEIRRGIILHKDNIKECLCTCHKELFDLFTAFDPGEEHPCEKRLISLFRIVDGKRFLCHFRNRFRIRDPFELDLAEWMASSGKIPDEIERFLNVISN